MTDKPNSTVASTTVSSSQCHYVYLAGDQSGVGKSSCAMGILAALVEFKYYEPREMAYIKPCTQCESIQTVVQYCHASGIEHRGIGPIVFYSNYTAECIDGVADSVEERHLKIKAAVESISVGKKFVLVDGVGYVSVGSVVQCSSVEVCKLLNSPVLIVGRSGIGNSIDSMNLMLNWFQSHQVQVIGAIFNKLPIDSSSHSYQRCKHYVEKYFEQQEQQQGRLNQLQFQCLGFIPLVKHDTLETQDVGAASAVVASDEVSCALSPQRRSLEFTPTESLSAQQFLECFFQHFDTHKFITQIHRFYTQQQQQQTPAD